MHSALAGNEYEVSTQEGTLKQAEIATRITKQTMRHATADDDIYVRRIMT